ncbi:MAG: stage III sporulation protein AG [Lachnospiraceae bacterium]|nr:stage III sporulation protein AG [Lachnospiraceae bacterium]
MSDERRGGEDGAVKKWRFSLKKLQKMKTETWILLLLAGILLFVIALPTEKKTEREKEETLPSVEPADSGAEDYVRELEKRVETLLSTIEGAGKTTVLLTVESDGETILQMDWSQEQKSTSETDSEGGVGSSEELSQSRQTVLFGSEDVPYVTKELCPKVTGVVVSAEGGDNVKVKTEISEAMEALFDVPPHKIKVLKRVKEES